MGRDGGPMSPTVWTEKTAPFSSWQEGLPVPGGGLVDFLFGAFVLTQPEFLAVIPPAWTERTAVAPSYTEKTATAVVWTEKSA